MLQAVLQHERKKKLQSVVKESRKFKLQLNITQEEIDINTKPTKVAKDIKKKANIASIDDFQKGWREKPIHGKYWLDRVTTYELSSSSLKRERERLYTRSSRPKYITTSIPIKNH